jgi:hypothetical protein
MKSRRCWLNLLADLCHFLVVGLRAKTSLAAENLFLRKQLAFYQERNIRPRRLDNPTRVTLVWLSRWFDWRDALTLVTPKTFIGWQRKGFQLYWRRKCRSGRPRIPRDLQHLIRRMASENPSWGEERIANELLLKLGLRVSPRTIRKYLPKLTAPGGHPRRDQRWSTFSQESRPSHRRLRLLPRSHRHFSNTLCVPYYGTCFAPNDSRKRDCPSERSLDPPAAARSHPLRPHLPFHHS